MATSSSMASATSPPIPPDVEVDTSRLTDIGWHHGTPITIDKKKVRCNYCGKEMHGGIHRLKHHLARLPGDIKKCEKVPEKISKEIKQYLEDKTQESKKRKDHKRNVGVFGSSSTAEEENEDEDEVTCLTKKAKEFPKVGTAQLRVNTSFNKNSRKRACEIIARWFYHAGIPFNAADSIFFPTACEAIGMFGKGLKPPTPYELAGPFLKAEVESINLYLREFKESWNETGCSIMSDGWRDQKGRTLINFLVSCPRGIMFIKSVDASHIVKDVNNLFNLLDEIVEIVGEKNVVQLITDNAANYVAARKLLMAKRKNLFWSSCAAHCIENWKVASNRNNS